MSSSSRVDSLSKLNTLITQATDLCEGIKMRRNAIVNTERVALMHEMRGNVDNMTRSKRQCEVNLNYIHGAILILNHTVPIISQQILIVDRDVSQCLLEVEWYPFGSERIQLQQYINAANYQLAQARHLLMQNVS